jgi:hypothetical protein
MRARAGQFRIANISSYFCRSALSRLVAFVLLLGCRSLPIADRPPCEPANSSSVQTNAIRSSDFQIASAFVTAGMICALPERLRANDAI